MHYQPPQKIELTEDESAWYEASLASTEPTPDSEPVADAREALFKSLVERDAIPEPRLRVFCDPALAEKHGRSPKEIFESNGTCGEDIWRHPHFAEYLRYFISGPDLPEAAIDGFCDILNKDAGTSGMVRDELRSHVRSSIRRFGLDRHRAASAFFRLAVEVGIEHDRHSIHSAALSTR